MKIDWKEVAANFCMALIGSFAFFIFFGLIYIWLT